MLLGIIIGILIASIILCIIFIPKVKSTQQIDNLIRQQNDDAQNSLNLLKNELQELNEQKNNILIEYRNLMEQSIQQRTIAEEQAQSYYNQHMQLANDRFNNDLELAEQQYEEAVQAFSEQYEEIKSSSAVALASEIDDRRAQILELDTSIGGLQDSLESKRLEIQAINNSLKILQAEIEEKNFYKIQLSDIDINEIVKLKEVVPYLRNGEPVSKIIWKSYYERPFNDLIGRLNANNACGIYKITNITNGMAYIGQSVNIADRWRTHVKSGLGIGSSNNKLYTAMGTYGVENFTFEILEQCERSKLNEQEKQWISNFSTNTWGYNMTGGGS